MERRAWSRLCSSSANTSGAPKHMLRLDLIGDAHLAGQAPEVPISAVFFVQIVNLVPAAFFRLFNHRAAHQQIAVGVSRLQDRQGRIAVLVQGPVFHPAAGGADDEQAILVIKPHRRNLRRAVVQHHCQVGKGALFARQQVGKLSGNNIGHMRTPYQVRNRSNSLSRISSRALPSRNGYGTPRMWITGRSSSAWPISSEAAAASSSARPIWVTWSA